MDALEEYRDDFKVIDSNIEVLITKFCQESEAIKKEIGYEIPIVLLVMNQTEAKELNSEEAFCDYHHGLCDNFHHLKDKLTQNGITNWVEHYQATPEQWQPFNQTDFNKNIKQLIEETFTEVQYQQKIVPKFIDIRKLNQDNKENFKLLKDLRNQGCIVIMDAISMQHPEIQRLFRSTALDAFLNTLVVMVAPVYSVFDIVKKIEGVIEQRIDIDFYRRLELNDSKCFKAGDKTGLQNWLIDKVPSLLTPLEKENISKKPWHNYGQTS